MTQWNTLEPISSIPYSPSLSMEQPKPQPQPLGDGATAIPKMIVIVDGKEA